MNNLNLILITVLLCGFTLVQPAQGCESAVVAKRPQFEPIKDIVDQLIKDEFPELCGVRIKVRRLKSESSFLVSNVALLKFALTGKREPYLLRVNEKLFEHSPTDAALRAILVHELNHMNDYVAMSTGQFRKFGIKYATKKKFMRSYERETDQKTVTMGYRQGLLEYRLWLKDQLSPEDWAEKRRTYLTPEELEAGHYALDNGRVNSVSK